MIEIPFIPGLLILLFLSILFAKGYRKIANYIGEGIRMFFSIAWKKIKN